MWKVTFISIPLLVFAGLLAVYNFYGGDPDKRRSREREHRAQTARPGVDIQVAAVWPFVNSDDPFVRGILLARDEINAKGGINGRKVKVVFYAQTPGVARKVVKDVNTVAVIGYSSSASAMRDVITYNADGVLFLMPFATNPMLTIRNFPFSFRTLADDELSAAWLAQHALTQAALRTNSTGTTTNELRIVSLAARTEYGLRFSRHFRKDAASWRLRIASATATNTTVLRVVHSRTYDPGATNFLPIVDKILEYQFDMVLLADVLPRAGYLIRQLRIMGVDQPILGGDWLDSSMLWNIASNKAFGVYFPSKFVWPASAQGLPKDLLIHSFYERYKTDGNQPDFETAQSYEAMHMLAQAVARASTSSPIAMASTLEHMENWRGMLETYNDFTNGDLVISNIFIKYIASADYPTNDIRRIQNLVMRDLKANPYTNRWHFAGYLSPAVTNKFLEIEHVGHTNVSGDMTNRPLHIQH